LKRNKYRCTEWKQTEVFLNWNSSQSVSQFVESHLPYPSPSNTALTSSSHLFPRIFIQLPFVHFFFYPFRNISIGLDLYYFHLHTFHWSSSASPHFYSVNRKILLTQTLLARTLPTQTLLAQKLLVQIF